LIHPRAAFGKDIGDSAPDLGQKVKAAAAAGSQPEHVQLKEPERLGWDDSGAAAFVKVNRPEPSARKTTEAVACAASGL
jgi:hypothetical protein